MIRHITFPQKQTTKLNQTLKVGFKVYVIQHSVTLPKEKRWGSQALYHLHKDYSFRGWASEGTAMCRSSYCTLCRDPLLKGCLPCGKWILTCARGYCLPTKIRCPGTRTKWAPMLAKSWQSSRHDCYSHQSVYTHAHAHRHGCFRQ